ncbi:MAG: MBL fold metallo-hydrolase [Myxococcota bacterium]
MIFRQLFDRDSSTYTYLLADEDTREALLIDPVRDQLERDGQLLEELGLTLRWTLETHVHADHIAGSGVLRQRLGSRSVMSVHAGAECADVMVEDGEVIELGGVRIEARLTPGHTDGCASYVVHDAAMVFTGDALLIRGCGRTDFQQGSSETLYRSVTEKLFSLPEHYAVYPGHDYRGRTVSSIGEEKAYNPRLGRERPLEEFVAIMASLKLAPPAKIDEAVPANLACGMPQASEALPERGWAPLERRDGVAEVSASWTKAHVGEFRLVDVRSAEEFAEGHLEGAELVPLDTLEDASVSWDREAPIVVMCRSGKRSGRAAVLLEGNGFRRVASMAGGMLALEPASCG